MASGTWASSKPSPISRNLAMIRLTRRDGSVFPYACSSSAAKSDIEELR